MDHDPESPIAPTLAKVLDKFFEAMKADDLIEDGAAERLDVLLRSGKAPKPDEVNSALFSPREDENNGADGEGS